MELFNYCKTGITNGGIHLFPSTREIIEAIPPETKVFRKLDTMPGYFQLALDRQSNRLTMFLIRQGRFHYLQAPMGLNASPDECTVHGADNRTSSQEA